MSLVVEVLSEYTAPWREQAACAGSHATFFVADDEDRHADRAAVAKCKAICAGCPVLVECRTWALTAPSLLEGHVVGGMSPDELRRARSGVVKRKAVRQRCGTREGYRDHEVNGTVACEDCKFAHSRYLNPNPNPTGPQW